MIVLAPCQCWVISGGYTTGQIPPDPWLASKRLVLLECGASMDDRINARLTSASERNRGEIAFVVKGPGVARTVICRL